MEQMEHFCMNSLIRNQERHRYHSFILAVFSTIYSEFRVLPLLVICYICYG